MTQEPPKGHSEAMRYVQGILAPGERDLLASEELDIPTEKLDVLDESFFARALESLIVAGGNRLVREMELVDEESGDKYNIRLEILKLVPHEPDQDLD